MCTCVRSSVARDEYEVVLVCAGVLGRLVAPKAPGSDGDADDQAVSTRAAPVGRCDDAPRQAKTADTA
jgi:hypothetical protein